MAHLEDYSKQLKKLLQEIESLHAKEVSELRAELHALRHNTPKQPGEEKVFDIDEDVNEQVEGADPVPTERRASAAKDDAAQKLAALEAEAAQAADAAAKNARTLALSRSRGFTVEEEEEDDDDTSALKRVGRMVMSPLFEFVICVLLLVNLVFMALNLQYDGMRAGYEIKYPRYDVAPIEEGWPWADAAFHSADIIFAIIFTIEMALRLGTLHLNFFRDVVNWIDLVVVASSWVQFFAAALPISPTFLRMLRLGKLLRAVSVLRLSDALESLQLLVKCIYASLRILFWSLVLLMVIQCSAGMTISYMLSDFMVTDAGNEQARFLVFRYYGTFTKTLLTMFEVLFANWSPACRVLIDNVSEWYALFFIVYRCFVGFAVLNVVNALENKKAVFVQSTMKVALADEEIIAREKARQQDTYRRRVNRIFRETDSSGDGVLNVDEFIALLERPQLQVWLHMLELDTTDLYGLFKMLDNGRGEISLEEFETGIKKMKGTAKSLDLHMLAHQVHKLNSKMDAMLGNSGGGFQKSFAMRSLSTVSKMG